MPYQGKLNGVYVITDDNLTPSNTLFTQVKYALKIDFKDKK